MTSRKNGQHSEPPALAALKRASQAALEAALRTGTPCHVLENGKIVDIATQTSIPTGSRARPKKSMGDKRA